MSCRYVLKKIRLARQTERCRRSAHQEVSSVSYICNLIWLTFQIGHCFWSFNHCLFLGIIDGSYFPNSTPLHCRIQGSMGWEGKTSYFRLTTSCNRPSVLNEKDYSKSLYIRWFHYAKHSLFIMQGCYVCIVTGYCEGGDMWVTHNIYELAMSL